MRFQLILFDFDGTLADSFEWFLAHLGQVAERFHLQKIRPEEVESLRDCDAGELLERYHVPFWKLPFVAFYLRSLMSKDSGGVTLFKEVPGLLTELKRQGAMLAIVSSNAESNVRRILGPELSSLVSFYECGTSMDGKAGRITKVIRKIGVDPGRVIFIGDEGRDVEAARKTGVASGAVAWGYNHACALERHRPTFLFRTMDELQALLEG